MNIKTPGYVDLMEADFSTTTSDQLITSQIMIMSSVQKYFDFGMMIMCGIPGVEMNGTLQDWKQLVAKTENLKSLLQPMIDELGLQNWFIITLNILEKLVDTFEGNPDKGTFLSEDTDVFVITPNKRTFFFPETENLNFGD